MAKQDAFTSEEWTLLRLVPSFVASGVVAADPSGLFSSVKESFAGAKGVAQAIETHGGLELFSALAADRSLPGMPDPKALLGEGSREQQMQNLKNAVLERVKSAVALKSEALFDGACEVLIDHRGVMYRLRQTSLGKLILTK